MKSPDFPAFPGKSARFLPLLLGGIFLCLGTAITQAANPDAPLRNLVYARAGGEDLKLDLYPPTAVTGLARPAPVIVFLHGGGWRIGSKKEVEPSVDAFTAAGYAVVSVDYRLSGHGRFPAQIFDCKAAVRWTRANAKRYGLDPQKIGALGFSAGGHLAALLGTSAGVGKLEDSAEGNPGVSSRVQAVCDVSGPTDLTIPARSLVGKLSIDGLFGGNPQEKPELAREANPAAYATRDDAPCLLIYGSADTLVPPLHGKILADALRKVGVEANLVIVQGGRHVPFFRQQQQSALAFFGRHL